jgi:tRNA (guanine37-N1)-methyltransferase
MLQLDVITIFPDFFKQPLETSVVGKAIAANKVKVAIHNLRDYGIGKHQLTDDRPYGGGPGMVMMVEPIHQQLQALGYKRGTPKELIVLTSAKGQLYNQQVAREWSKLKRIAIVCGHYEGVDERVVEHLIDREIRIGDYVLTGGEPASLVIIDSLTRLQPDVLGNQQSLVAESHDKPGFFGPPQYTRSENYQGWNVPKVLLTGDHQKVAKFRQKQTEKK